MNVLWFTNVSIPEADQLMGVPSHPFGGWFVSLCRRLVSVPGYSLSIAFPRRGLDDVVFLQGQIATYYPFPYIRERKACREMGRAYQENVHTILQRARPDLVVVYGTESPHALSVVEACDTMHIPCAISLQGLLFTCAEHYLSGVPDEVQRSTTLVERIRHPGNLLSSQRAYRFRSQLEQAAIKRVGHVIGRTTWDKACVGMINPKARYHACNETLRDAFYASEKWSLAKCERHSILISQWSYPIKGFHFMLRALALIREKYPDVKVYVCGGKAKEMDRPMWLNRVLGSSYRIHIRELIHDLNLESCIRFTGTLNEQEMAARMRSSHVFVSASTVENESNSLSEAKYLGVPCVASYVGGVIDRIKHGKDGFLYQHDAPYMLAHYVCQIFGCDELAVALSLHAIDSATVVNDRAKNLSELIAIYKTILGQDQFP